MNKSDRIDAGQLRALCFVSFLSPALRFCPGSSISEAGRAAWLSMLLSFPLLLLYAAFLRRFLRCRREGEGLAELCRRAVGQKLGKALLLVFALWLTFYAGFVLRAGAERFITTIYPHSTPTVFVLALGLLAALAALGPSRTLARTAALVLPLLTAALAVILLSALLSARPENLLPVALYDLAPAVRGALPAVDVQSGVLLFGAFLSGAVPHGSLSPRRDALWLGCGAGFLCLLNAAILGAFGAELAERLTHPFFSLVRNLVFFRSVERMEALAVTLWVFPDFLLSSTALFAAQLCLRRALGQNAAWEGEKPFSLTGGRKLIPLCALAAILGGLWMAPDQHAFLFLSKHLVPVLNLSLAFLVLPAVYVLGKRKGRI